MRNFTLFLLVIAVCAKGQVIDNNNPDFIVVSGNWKESAAISGFIGGNYIHDQKSTSLSEVRWELNNANGDFEVQARWTSHPNRASNVFYQVVDRNGFHSVTVNQRRQGGEWVSLGVFSFPTEVMLSNDGANGYVIADAVQLMPVNIDSDADGLSDTD